MSSSIWTQCGARANLRRLAGKPWRVVEGQHVVATRKLVDSAADQAILEGLIEATKPAVPPAIADRRLHYLLSTPFRYPPLRHGSRFGGPGDPSLWYGSIRLHTAFAETAYYRLLFLEGTTADLSPVELELTAFRVPVRTAMGVDLCRPPFDLHRDVIASPVSYEASQALGREMRAEGVEAFRYPSARDGKYGVNVSLFSAAPFGATEPEPGGTWHCVADRARVEFARRDLFDRRVVGFVRSQFEVDGRLPAPAP